MTTSTTITPDIMREALFALEHINDEFNHLCRDDGAGLAEWSRALPKCPHGRLLKMRQHMSATGLVESHVIGRWRLTPKGRDFMTTSPTPEPTQAGINPVCPNPECKFPGHLDLFDSGTSLSAFTVSCWCGTRSAGGDTKEDGVRLWNLLPRPGAVADESPELTRLREALRRILDADWECTCNMEHCYCEERTYHRIAREALKGGEVVSEKSYTIVSSGTRWAAGYCITPADEPDTAMDVTVAELARTSCDLADANRRVARLEGALQRIADDARPSFANFAQNIARAALAPLEGEEVKT